jgi:hypothetical protein
MVSRHRGFIRARGLDSICGRIYISKQASGFCVLCDVCDVCHVCDVL